jgi:hypothetical protein
MRERANLIMTLGTLSFVTRFATPVIIIPKCNDQETEKITHGLGAHVFG